MFRQDKATRHLWHPDLFEIFDQARIQKSAVTLQCHLPLDLCNSADITLTGKFGPLNNQMAKFRVESMDFGLEKRFPLDPACEYAFAIDLPMGKRRFARMEYNGKATILERVLGRNDLPIELLLRVSLPTRIRHVRRHQRMASAQCASMIPGLILIDQAPVDRRQLLRLLGHYFRKNKTPQPRLINISAGGVCVETSDSSGYRLLAADERYLFFFFLRSPKQEKTPMVFLGRKVGAFKAESGSAALRIQFLSELVWTGPNMDLEWIDISANGSDKLRQLLGLPQDESPAIPIPEPEKIELPKPAPRPRKIRPRPPEIPPIEQMATANMALPYNKND